jgi:hypothetical protein
LFKEAIMCTEAVYVQSYKLQKPVTLSRVVELIHIMYIHAYIRTYIRAYIHTHTHTHTCTQIKVVEVGNRAYLFYDKYRVMVCEC